MEIAVRYFTRSGNTEKLAKAVAAAVEVEALTINEPLTQKTDILFLCSSYYAFDIDPLVKEFIINNKEKYMISYIYSKVLSVLRDRPAKVWGVTLFYGLVSGLAATLGVLPIITMQPMQLMPKKPLRNRLELLMRSWIRSACSRCILVLAVQRCQTEPAASSQGIQAAAAGTWMYQVRVKVQSMHMGIRRAAVQTNRQPR